MRERLLNLILAGVQRAPFLILLVAVAALVISLPAAGKVELKSSQIDMLPKGNPVVRRWIDFTDDFDIHAYLFVIVRGPELDKAKQFALELDRELRAFPKLVSEVEYRLDPKLYENQQLYFLSQSKLKGLEKGLIEGKPNLQTLASSPGFVSLTDVFLKELQKEEPSEPEEIEGFFTFIEEVCIRLAQVARGDEADPIPWTQFFGLGGGGEGHNDPFADGGWKLSTRKNGILIAIHPTDSTDEFDFIIPFYEKCREVAKRLQARYPGIDVGLAGQPALIYSQRDTVHQDLQTTSTFSLVGVSLVFIWGFRGIGLPLLAIASLLSAIIWTFGAISISPGHLNLITTAFVSMLLGLGVDYGIYIVSQFAEKRREGLMLSEAVEGAIRGAGPGVMTGGLTACAGFSTLMLTEFPGFQELGQISGVGLMFCMISMLCLLPVLLQLVGGFATSLGTSSTSRVEVVLEKVARFSIRNSMVVLLVFVCLALVLAGEAFQVEFDYNIQNLEPEDTEAVIYETIMQKEFEVTPDTNMVLAATLEEARAKKRALQGHPSIGDIDSYSDYLPEFPGETRIVLKRMAKEVEDIHFQQPSHLDGDKLLSNLKAIADRLKNLKLPLLITSEATVVLQADRSELAARAAILALGEELNRGGKARVEEYQARAFQDLSEGFADLQAMLGAEPFDASRLPPSIRKRYRGKSGRYVLFVSPRVNVRVESQANQFITETQTVDPEATGVPILLDEVLLLLRRGFKQATIYSLTAVVILVFLDFRSLRLTLLALTPLLISLATTVGMMKVLDVRYNPANFVSLPILTGLGMAYGVYLLHRLLQHPEEGTVGAVRSTGKSILLSCMTSMVALGSLSIAQNRGLSSLGQIILMGLGVCLLTCVVMLPALAEAIGFQRREKVNRLARLKDELLSFRF